MRQYLLMFIIAYPLTHCILCLFYHPFIFPKLHYHLFQFHFVISIILIIITTNVCKDCYQSDPINASKLHPVVGLSFRTAVTYSEKNFPIIMSDQDDDGQMLKGAPSGSAPSQGVNGDKGMDQARIVRRQRKAAVTRHLNT